MIDFTVLRKCLFLLVLFLLTGGCKKTMPRVVEIESTNCHLLREDMVIVSSSALVFGVRLPRLARAEAVETDPGRRFCPSLLPIGWLMKPVVAGRRNGSHQANVSRTGLNAPSACMVLESRRLDATTNVQSSPLAQVCRRFVFHWLSMFSQRSNLSNHSDWAQRPLLDAALPVALDILADLPLGRFWISVTMTGANYGLGFTYSRRRFCLDVQPF